MTDTNTAQMVVDLRATDDAVRAKGWVAPGLGVPGAPLGLLSSSMNPLGALAAAGLSWFMPLVSFLGEPLTQLQGGDGASVSAGSDGFGTAGQDIAGVADEYRASANAQTSGWSGAAASDYRESAAQHAEGVAGLGEASNTTASAIIGAGQVVAQAIAEVTELIAEAVSQIVPIMTQAIARAGETFGQSVVEAIPPCVAIAVEYALRIAAKLAALLASGDNLMKLVQGGMAIVELIQTALTSISQQSLSADASASVSNGQGTMQASASGSVDPEGFAALGNVQGSAPASAAGGSGGGSGGVPAMPSGGSFEGNVSRTPTTSTYSSGFTPQPHIATQDTPRPLGQTGGGSGGSGGGLPIGTASGAGAGAGTGAKSRGESSVRFGAGRGGGTAPQESGQQSGGGSGNGSRGMGAMPMGAMGGMRPGGDADKDHQRRYPLIEEQHDEVFEIDRLVQDDLEPELPAAEPRAVNRDDEYFTNPPEITR
ncbi:MAG: hypothetical protein WBA97_39110 [Actinophytocola sp.]|uniref:WXG100 family type VII secretion target n=1 Tax=Actinophytocola sp. TaxID=1872138 RepID=UPI003C7392C7